MKENRLWILIARGLSGEATDKDFEELNRLLKKHPETSFHVAILLNWWKHDSRNLACPWRASPAATDSQPSIVSISLVARGSLFFLRLER